MELSDTSSVTFVNHPVPDGHYLIVPDDAGLGCISDYQRSWFHLFIAEIYLARVEHLGTASCSEVSRLRQQSLRLLDDFAVGADVGPLLRTTAALKLRVSMMAQTTATVLRSRGLAAQAGGLGYIKSQPTADRKIQQEAFSSRPSPAASSPRPRRQVSAPPAAGPTDASCA
jgi:hypothetical protein